jgi:methyl-accepting chemotaxis protein
LSVTSASVPIIRSSTAHNFSEGARRLADGDLTGNSTTTVPMNCMLPARISTTWPAPSALLGGVQRCAAYQRGVRAGCLVEPADFGQQRSQSDSASSMAAAVEETTVGIDHIAKNAQDAQDYSRRSDEVAAEGGRIVLAVVQEIQGIAQTVNQSAAAVEALASSPADLGHCRHHQGHCRPDQPAGAQCGHRGGAGR